MDYERLGELIRENRTEEWQKMVREAFSRPVSYYRRGMLTREELMREIQSVSFHMYDRYFGSGRNSEDTLDSETLVLMQKEFHIPDAMNLHCPEGMPIPRCYRKMNGTGEVMEVRMDLPGWELLADADVHPGKEYVVPAEDGVAAYFHDVVRDTERNLMGYHMIRYQAMGHVYGYTTSEDRLLKLEVCINPRPLLLISFELQPGDSEAFDAHWSEYVAFGREREARIRESYEKLLDELIREAEKEEPSAEEQPEETAEIIETRPIRPEPFPAPGNLQGGHIGALIALEGIDGCGKSTQIRLLAERLAAEGIPCSTTREPTDSPFGRLLRQVLAGEVESDPRVIAPLFVADRLDHLLHPKHGLAKRVESGEVILTDRYYFSSYAYQSVDLPMEWVITANEPCSEILRPMLTVFLDVSPEEAMKRIRANREGTELFENTRRLADTRAKFFEAFARLADKEKYVVIDGTGSQEEVAERIFEKVMPLIRTEEVL